MRAVAAAVAILAILASPHGLGAFLPGEPGPAIPPSPAGPAPREAEGASERGSGAARAGSCPRSKRSMRASSARVEESSSG